jgi:rSAM/selenodomain-associated transferase 2
MSTLSIIVPVLNEQATIVATLTQLAPLRMRGVEVIVVDGGSADDSIGEARGHADQVMSSPRGRGAQMNAGAHAARGDVLLFLHVDTRLPAGVDSIVLEGLARSRRLWGRFDVAISGRSALLPLVAALMNARSRLSGIATGDQAMFVRRDAFLKVGGFPDTALMEDIGLSRRLKRLSRPLCLGARAVTSGRRWDNAGALRTILLMWRLRFAFFLGANPTALARRYGYVPRQP